MTFQTTWPWPFATASDTDVPLPTPLGRDRRIFTKDGKPWCWKGVSAFALCDRFARGDDIDTFLAAFDGYNLLRVWDYVTWEGTGWSSQRPDVWARFLDYVAAKGFYVELTLLTDDDPARIAPAKNLVNELARAKPPNLVLEIGNEPRTHKQIDVKALRAACDASGFLYASGNNNTDEDWFGLYLTAHTPRDNEWPRKCHDLLEYYSGGGPEAPTDPPRRVPCVGDEPIRPDQAAVVWNGDWRLTALDFRAYFAGCVMMGAGGTVHFEGGKYCVPPTAGEKACIDNALLGLSAFPAESSNLGYRRIDEQGKSSRTYVAGDSMLRIRPRTLDAPEPGWRMLDEDGILWTR